MKRFLVFVLAAAVLCAASAAFAQAATEAITFNLGGDLDRVKLRAAPSTDAAVLGQYFAFVKTEVLAEDGEWWRVRIGDREGYMMSRFLTKDVPDNDTFVQGQSGRVCTGNASEPLYAAPTTDASVLTVMDAGNLYVLGTVNGDWLHVLYRAEGAQPVTGYASGADIAMTENLATVAVNTGSETARLNLRALPSQSAVSLGLFFSGTEMDRLFDDHVNGDGWTLVRIGGLVGYATDTFLTSADEGGLAYRPPLSGTKYASVPVFDGPYAQEASDSVTERDVFAVLGVCGARYYIRVLTGEAERFGYVESKDVRGVTASVHTGGTLKHDQVLYDQDGNGDIVPSDTAGRASTIVTVLGSLTDAGTIFPYIASGSEWLSCFVDTGENGEVYGLVPREAVKHDPGLEMGD